MDRRKNKYTGGINDYCNCEKPYKIYDLETHCIKCGMRIKTVKKEIKKGCFDSKEYSDNYLF